MDVKTKTERQTKEMVKETVFKERAQKVLASMKENGMDQLIVSDPASINYLMGRLMNPGERLMVLVFDAAAGKTELVISKLYPQGDNPIWPVTYVDDVDDCVAILSEKIAETGVIGIDKNWAAKFLLRLMELRPNLTYKNGSYIIDKIRQIKTNEEQEFMIEASRLNDLAVERLIKEVNKGYTEKELADKLLDIYHDLGSEGFSFYPICCYGANAAAIIKNIGYVSDSVQIFDYVLLQPHVLFEPSTTNGNFAGITASMSANQICYRNGVNAVAAKTSSTQIGFEMEYGLYRENAEALYNQYASAFFDYKSYPQAFYWESFGDSTTFGKINDWY